MVISCWILLFLCMGLGAWGVYQYRCLNRKTRRLENALLEANEAIHQREERHAENESRREKTEEKLRRYLKLMDTLINTISNPIYFKDAQGIFQGCNNVFSKQILGLTRDRIIGKRPQELSDQIPPDLAAACLREELRMAEKAGFHTFETQVRCADSHRRDFLFSLAPVMDGQGEFSGSVAVMSDLTDKNHAAQDRMQKEKLEGVLETAGAICHEFNQPLQALSGYTELLAVKLSGHEAGVFIEKLFTQIERMRDITDKLQGITRYETTDYAGNTKIIDIHKASEKDQIE